MPLGGYSRSTGSTPRRRALRVISPADPPPIPDKDPTFMLAGQQFRDYSGLMKGLYMGHEELPKEEGKGEAGAAPDAEKK